MYVMCNAYVVEVLDALSRMFHSVIKYSWVNLHSELLITFYLTFAFWFDFFVYFDSSVGIATRLRAERSGF
jgi:hypothetical protein